MLEQKTIETRAERDARLAILVEKLDRATKQVEDLEEAEARESSGTRSEEPQSSPESPEEKAEAEIEAFLAEFNLKTDLPTFFEMLPTPNKLLLINTLKQRTLDLVRGDAQTQYSDELRARVAKSVGKSGKIWGTIKSISASVRASVTKEMDLKNAESQIFKKLQTTEDGKNLIYGELQQISRILVGRSVVLDNKGKPQINFLDEQDLKTTVPAEALAVKAFNVAANKLREIPYEWGQEKSGKNKKAFDKAKKEYNEANTKILQLESVKNPTHQPLIATEMMEFEIMIKMDQLLNTHPEFEKEMSLMAQTAGGAEVAKTGLNFLRNMTGKSGERAGLAAMGAGLRLASLGISTAVSAPAIGALIGGIRGWIRAKDTLIEKQKSARSGAEVTTEDKKEKRIHVVEAGHLAEKLESLLAEIHKFHPKNRIGESEQEKKQRDRKIALLSTRINHTKGKIELGQVNFGNTKSTLENQYRLANTLNSAFLLQHLISPEVNKEVQKSVDMLLKAVAKDVSGTTTEKQKLFIRKEVMKSAGYGLAFASAGYLVRHLGENFGWWGGNNISQNKEQTNSEQSITEKIKHLKDAVSKIFRGETSASNGEQTNLNFLKHSPAGELNPDADEHSKFHGTNPNSPYVMTESVNGPIVPPSETGGEPTLDTFNAKIGMTETISGPSGADLHARALDEIKNSLDSKTIAEKASDIRGVDTEFSLSLGQNGVPKHLESVFNAISADYMQVPADGAINEEFATKSLNMAANLVRLTEGHGVAGITQAEWTEAGNFLEGKLEIKDHGKFNAILAKLQDHSNGLWSKGALQSEGAAITYVPKISQDSWLKVLHAEGLHETVDGTTHTPTGILGHQEITGDKIKDFDKSAMVAKAREAVYEKMGDESGVIDAIPKSDYATDVLTQTTKQVANVSGPTAKLDPLKDILVEKVSQPSADGQNITFGRSTSVPFEGEKFDLTRDNRSDGYNVTYGRGWGMTDYEQAGMDQAAVTREMVAYADSVYLNNIEKIFPENTEDLWVKASATPATEVMEITEVSAKEQNLTRLISYLNRLQEVTGLEPESRSVWRFRPAETTEDYVKRAVRWATENRKLEDIKIKS